MRMILTDPRRPLVVLALALGIFLVGCNNDSGDTRRVVAGATAEPDLVETARSAGNFGTLLTALEEAGLTETLENDGPFTVFAPTDAAFSKIPKADLDALLADKDALTNVLLYHVVDGELDADALLAAGAALGKQGGTLRISEGSVYVNDSLVVDANIGAGNGIIHAIDTVLTPPPENDIVDTAAEANIFNTLLAAVGIAELEDALRDVGPLTVFAPTDAAFEKIPKEDLDALIADKDALTQVLLYHVVRGQILEQDLVGVTSANTLAVQPLLFDTTGAMTTVNQAMVTGPDVLAANGVIHIIDEVLMPPTENIVGTAIAAELATLVLAVQDANLVETLESEGPYTVFAPTEAAFAKIPLQDLQALLQDEAALRNVLLYHVVAGRIFSGDLPETGSVTTENGQDISIDTRNGVMINNAMVVGKDILATNGVVHLIDTVLLPPPN